MNGQYLIKKNHDHGFTIIELLVVMIVIGILSAALPSLYLINKNTIVKTLLVIIAIGILSIIALQHLVDQSRTQRSRLFTAKYHVYVINRIQGEYFLKHKKFANSIEELKIEKLKIGIQFENPDYDYSTTATNGASYSYGITKKQDSRSFVGAVFKIPAANKSEITTIAILCKNEQSGNIIPPQPILKNDLPICRAGTTEVK